MGYGTLHQSIVVRALFDLKKATAGGDRVRAREGVIQLEVVEDGSERRDERGQLSAVAAGDGRVEVDVLRQVGLAGQERGIGEIEGQAGVRGVGERGVLGSWYGLLV